MSTTLGNNLKHHVQEAFNRLKFLKREIFDLTCLKHASTLIKGTKIDNKLYFNFFGNVTIAHYSERLNNYQNTHILIKEKNDSNPDEGRLIFEGNSYRMHDVINSLVAYGAEIQQLQKDLKLIADQILESQT